MLTQNQISAYRRLSLYFISSIYLVVLPHKEDSQTKVYYKFSLCLKRNNPQTFTSISCKSPFLQCVCYWYKLLRWMFLISCDNWKTLLIIKVYRYSEIFLTTMLLLFYWSQCFERSSYFMHYLHNSSAILILKFQNKADTASQIFVTTFTFAAVPNFSL